jgi:tight adherence protein C
MSLPLITSVLFSLSVLLVFTGLRRLRPDAGLRDRMELYAGSVGTPERLEEIELRQSFTGRLLKPLALRAFDLAGSAMPHKRLGKLRKRLLLAGEPAGLTPARFMGIKIWATIVMGAMAALYAYSLPEIQLRTLGMLVGWTGMGYRLPDMWISRRIKRRQLELTNSLPDALDMLTIAVEAGLSFDQGMGEIVSRWKNELSHEFRRVLNAIGMGTSRREALEQFRERTGVPDIASFVVAVNHAEDLGTSLGDVLNVQSAEMRTRRRQRAQEKAAKVPVKMMIPMVLFIFPAMFAVILGPAVPRIIRVFGSI